MSVLYKEINRFLIRDISNSELACYIDPVISIIIKLINIHNDSFVQFIAENSLLTNDVQKIIDLLDIRVGFFKSYLRNSIVQSKFQYYNTFEAFILCRIIRDFSLLGDSFSVQEKLDYIKKGEELIYKQIKELKIQLADQNLNQLVNFSELIEMVFQNYLKQNIDLFINDKFYLNFVNIKSSFYDFQAFNDSYVLELSDRNMIQNQFIQTKDQIMVNEIILCDFSPSFIYFRNKVFQDQKKTFMVVTTSVLDQQEIDSFYSLQNILLVCNVQLKIVRELSFLFSIKVNQSLSDIEDNIIFYNGKHNFILKLLYRQNIEFNRRESEIFHLKNRIPLLIQSQKDMNKERRQVLSTVISVPSSLAHKQQSISQQIKKQFKKLQNIFKTKKLVKGFGGFEIQLSQKIQKNIKQNPYIMIMCQIFSDYSQYLHLQQTNQNNSDIFFDDYKQKKQIIQKANQVLKLQTLTTLEMQYFIQKK
ncbi:hypothetical protein ABPG72_014661 [Tetrahymena utriculariae]